MHCSLVPTGELQPLEIVYLKKIVGWNGRQNEVIVARRPNVGDSVVVFFPGDMQDVSVAMRSRYHSQAYARWCLENVLVVLAKKFPGRLLMAIKAAEITEHDFACYTHFVPSDSRYGIPSFCDDYGAWLHLEHLIRTVMVTLSPESSVLPDHVTLIGFSKGCVVLNQLICEVPSASRSQLAILGKVKAIYWLDGGHSGRTSTWICDETILKCLRQNLPLTKFQIDVSPYQVKDARRPWVGEQQAQFVRLLNMFGIRVTVREHFAGESPSLENHFRIIDEFQP